MRLIKKDSLASIQPKTLLMLLLKYFSKISMHKSGKLFLTTILSIALQTTIFAGHCNEIICIGSNQHKEMIHK